MDKIPIIFAKLSGLQKTLDERLLNADSFFEPNTIIEYFERFNALQGDLKILLPELYDDLIIREIPKPIKNNHNFGKGYIDLQDLLTLKRDISYILEVRANSRIGEKIQEKEKKEFIFISHGRSNEWYKLQSYIERDLKYKTIELAQQPNLGRTILQKLDEESDKCSSAIIAMTGDDILEAGEVRARENVLHEIGFFQGKFGLKKIILLHEEGVNIPSNIHGLVYIPFPKNTIEATFGVVLRELNVILA